MTRNEVVNVYYTFKHPHKLLMAQLAIDVLCDKATQSGNIIDVIIQKHEIIFNLIQAVTCFIVCNE